MKLVPPLLLLIPLTTALPLNLIHYYENLRQSVLNHPFSLPTSLWPVSSAPKLLSTSSHLGFAESVLLISKDDYERWIERETHMAFESIIQNIGGCYSGPDLADGAVTPGAVVASPSKQAPDYFYQWVRDAGITVNTLVTAYADQQAQNTTLRTVIRDYITAARSLQRVSNPSGDFTSLAGLGEPKFHVDGTSFEDHWGRPQRDGPALRAMAIINYLNTEVRHHKSSFRSRFVRNTFVDVIRHDLDYVARYWQDEGFDLWEEVKGHHFFTAMVHKRALELGAELARNLGHFNLAQRYRQEAQNVTAFIKDRFYDKVRGHLIETLDYSSRSGLDSALFLGTIHATDLLADNWEVQENVLYAPHSDEIAASLVKYLDDMRYRYPINHQRLQAFERNGINSSLVGFGVGRYPEDVYNGLGMSIGNPWFLCTATVSHNLYLLADYLYTRPASFSLMVTEATKPLYGLFLSTIPTGFDWNQPGPFIYPRSDPYFTEFVQSIVAFADSFLDVIREHHDQSLNGEMSEQFNRHDGYMTGAEKLTWSYGAFWSAARQRQLVYKKMMMKQ
jgi:glucoamylase